MEIEVPTGRVDVPLHIKGASKNHQLPLHNIWSHWEVVFTPGGGGGGI